MNFNNIENNITNKKNTNYPIMQKTNLILFFGILAVNVFLLWVASHLGVIFAGIAIFLFAHTHNTMFSLLHEAVHGIFLKSKFTNNIFGTLAATTFPTSFTIQRISHLGHHKRNRTDKEIYDYYLPHESKKFRNFLLYSGNLMGFYWLSIPVINILILLFPFIIRTKKFQHLLQNLGFGEYLADVINKGNLTKVWLECLLAFIYQVAIFYFLDLSFWGWFLCYYAFALHWSALQYVDHAWSPRDIINGAWNLKVLKISRLLALNYHYHLAHHQNPEIPWNHLPKLVNKSDKQPSFWSIYFSLWGGVRPAPAMINIKK